MRPITSQPEAIFLAFLKIQRGTNICGISKILITLWSSELRRRVVLQEHAESVVSI
jgi:hypothetical protein